MIKEAKFILDKPKATEPTYIFLKFSCKDFPLKYSTQEKIHPNDWDILQQRSKKNRNINRELDRLSGIVEQYLESQKKLGIRSIYKSELKNQLDSLSHKIQKTLKADTNNFNFACACLIAEARAGSLLTIKSQKVYSNETIDWWEKVIKTFNSFDAGMQMDQISMDTYTRFIMWCNNKGLSINYTGGMIGAWKQFLTHAYRKKWHSNLIGSHPDFKRIGEVSLQVYLNDDEILALINVELERKMHQKIRDRFVINLYNGLRITDMKTLSNDNIQNEMITHTNQKTHKTVVIPVHPVVADMIERYEGKMPKQYKDAIVNREIKIIAEKAGITEKIRFTKTLGGVTKEFVKEKWEMISNHTARRSMATNLLKHVNIQDAQPVLGMSLKTLQHYNKISPKENAERLKDNSFFTRKGIKEAL